MNTHTSLMNTYVMLLSVAGIPGPLAGITRNFRKVHICFLDGRLRVHGSLLAQGIGSVLGIVLFFQACLVQHKSLQHTSDILFQIQVLKKKSDKDYNFPLIGGRRQ